MGGGRIQQERPSTGMKFNLPQGFLGEVGGLCNPGGGAHAGVAEPLRRLPRARFRRENLAVRRPGCHPDARPRISRAVREQFPHGRR